MLCMASFNGPWVLLCKRVRMYSFISTTMYKFWFKMTDRACETRVLVFGTFVTLCPFENDLDRFFEMAGHQLEISVTDSLDFRHLKYTMFVEFTKQIFTTI